jgi:UDP-glucose 4-epimerase/GDP-4-dehydro-6-deoxy-D-mannose reductase
VFEWSENLDSIVHSAAIVPVPTVNQDLTKAIMTNVVGTTHLASAAAHTSTGHITYISSSHVYKGSQYDISEDHSLEPTNLYGLTKLQGEQWIQAITENYLIIRVFSFFSSDQMAGFLVPALAERISKSSKKAILELHNADVLRDIADADWMSSVCVPLILKQENGVINCGTGMRHTVLEIAEKLLTALGRMDCVWREKTGDDKNGLVANTSRLKTKLSHFPPFNLENSLRKFAEDMSANVPKED